KSILNLVRLPSNTILELLGCAKDNSYLGITLWYTLTIFPSLIKSEVLINLISIWFSFAKLLVNNANIMSQNIIVIIPLFSKGGATSNFSMYTFSVSSK